MSLYTTRLWQIQKKTNIHSKQCVVIYIITWLIVFWSVKSVILWTTSNLSLPHNIRWYLPYPSRTVYSSDRTDIDIDIDFRSPLMVLTMVTSAGDRLQ